MNVRRFAKSAVSAILPLYLPLLRFRVHPVVLLYHEVKPEVQDPRRHAVSVAHFRCHLAWLATHCTVVTLGEYVRRRGEGTLAANMAVITFDDGLIDSFLHGFPLVREFGLPMTLFVATEWIGTSRCVSREQLGEMVRGGVEVLPHSLSHPRLTQLPAVEQAREIAESRREVEAITGRPATVFAYPFGDYDEGTVKIVEDAGFEAAVTIEDLRDRPGISPFEIPRHSVPSVPLREWVFNVYEHRRFISTV